MPKPKVKDTYKNLLVLAIYMHAKENKINHTQMHTIASDPTAVDGLETSLHMEPVQEEPPSTAAAFFKGVFKIMQTSSSTALQLVGITGGAAMQSGSPGSRESSYHDLSYLVPESFEDSCLDSDTLARWKKLYSLALVYQEGKRERFFGGNYDPNQFKDERYLIIALLGRLIKKIAKEATEEKRAKYIRHCSNFVDAIVAFDHGKLVESSSDDTITLSLRTVMLAVKNTISEQSKQDEVVNYNKRLIEIISEAPNKIRALIEQLEKDLKSLIIPEKLRSGFPNSQMTKLEIMPKPSMELKKVGFDPEFVRNYFLITAETFDLNEGSMSNVWQSIKVKPEEIASYFSSEAFFPFQHTSTDQITSLVAELLTNKNKLLVIEYYLVQLSKLTNIAGQFTFLFIKDEIQKLFEEFKLTIIEVNRLQYDFLIACNSIYPSDREFKKKNNHLEWRKNFVIYDRNELARKLKSNFELSNEASMAILSGLISNPVAEAHERMTAICKGIGILCQNSTVAVEREIDAASNASKNAIELYQSKVIPAINHEVQTMLGRFVDVQEEYEVIDATNRNLRSRLVTVELEKRQREKEVNDTTLELDAACKTIEVKNNFIFSLLIEEMIFPLLKEIYKLQDEVLVWKADNGSSSNPSDFFKRKSINTLPEEISKLLNYSNQSFQFLSKITLGSFCDYFYVNGGENIYHIHRWFLNVFEVAKTVKCASLPPNVAKVISSINEKIAKLDGKIKRYIEEIFGNDKYIPALKEAENSVDVAASPEAPKSSMHS